MKIISLVDNISNTDLKAKHGLSFYIETNNTKILFDLGPDNTILKNALKLNINLSDVDIVVISHGHIDHGGALKEFLKINQKAKIYIQENAFNKHFSKTLCFKIPVGIDESLKNHPQINLINGNFKINDTLELFIVRNQNICHSSMNDVLYENNHLDNFLHEQNLIIRENNHNVLIIGCGHAGVINIMNYALQFNPTICIGGFHLSNPITKKQVSKKFLNTLITELNRFSNIEFYTCHCTGSNVFKYLSNNLNNIFYLSCGEELNIQ